MFVYRYRDGTWYNSLLLIYIVVIAGSGIGSAYLLSSDGASLSAKFALFCLTTALLAHSFILAAYFAHDCMHNSIFKQTKVNDRFGTTICFLLGAGYYPYSRLKEKHFRHHVERQDVLSINLRGHLEKHPRTKAIIAFLEGMHIPAAELYSHSLAITAPFFIDSLKVYRGRVSFVFLIYLLVLATIGLYSLLSLAAVLLAVIFCYSVLGFMDMFQHDYEIKLSLDSKKEKPIESREYEETHTYSNLISTSAPWLNLLVLNFCYHNVHHKKSGEPWYRLPKLHAATYKDSCAQEVSLTEQLKRYHQHRRARVVGSRDLKVSGRETGASGVSFLVGI